MKKDDKILAEALDRFQKAQDFERESRELATEDFRFAAGEQWPDQIRKEREATDRPCLTFNRLPQFIQQVIGDARQNKPAIKVLPIDSGADVETAEIYNGLIRNIESQSRAAQAYITAFEHAVTGGLGAWRVVTDYAFDDSFEQDIRIKRITNPFAVWWDPNAKEYDKSDAQWCFVSEWMTKEAFEAAYPKETPADWEQEYRGGTVSRHWVHGERVRLAEYWCKKPVKKTIGLFVDQMTGQSRVVEVKPGMEGIPFEATREVESFKVIRYLLSGHTILEGPEEFPSQYIPIVPVFGPEEWIDDRYRYRSLIRHAKDAQRAYNFWQTTIAEKIALAPRAPFLVTSKNVAGYEKFWNAANRENRPYLPYEPDPANGGQAPQRQQPAVVNAAELQQSAEAAENLKATMGIYDASLGAQGNETSGRAIIARQREGDNATYSWIDNLARSIQHTGRILVDMIPRIYDTARVVRILGEDESADMVPINTVIGGQMVHDITVGKYDVEVIAGPSYATKRMEAAESMMAFMQAVPQSAAVVADLLASAMDWPKSDVIADRLRKMLPPGISEEEQSPEEQQAQMEAQQQQMQEQEELKQMQKAMAMAEVEYKRAQAAKALTEAEAQDIENDAVQTGIAQLLERLSG
jgi:hypothetical protein